MATRGVPAGAQRTRGHRSGTAASGGRPEDGLGVSAMELYFCAECGGSVPNAEVDAGTARDADGRTLCADHRKGGSVPEQAAAAAAAGDLELLFCANCRVSVPVTDVRAGRARREYGSLLCAVCSRADPGERAQRRESVEAEMAADAEADDPVVAMRCSVCSAAVPHGHVVTGKAVADGDRITCQSCRAVAGTMPRSGSRLLSTVGLFLLVAAVAGAVGYLVGPVLQEKFGDKKPDPTATRLAALERSLDERFARLEASIPDGVDASVFDGIERQIRASSDDLETQVDRLRAELGGVRGELARADVAIDQRLARLEGRFDGLGERVSDLAAKGGASAPPPVVTEPRGGDDPRRDPPGGDDVGGDDMADDDTAVPKVDPEVTRVAKGLLESDEDGVRFQSANDLGNLGDPSAIPALAHALVNDRHFLVRRACARALGKLKAWMAVPYLCDALEDKEAYVAQQASFALQEITQQDFEVTQDQSLAERKRKAKGARKWWDANSQSPPDTVSRHGAELVQ